MKVRRHTMGLVGIVIALTIGVTVVYSVWYLTREDPLDRYQYVSLADCRYVQGGIYCEGCAVWAYDTEEEVWLCYDPYAPVNELTCELAVKLTQRDGLYDNWISNCEGMVEIPCIE